MGLGLLLITVFVVDVVFLNTFVYSDWRKPGAGRHLSGRALASMHKTLMAAY